MKGKIKSVLKLLGFLKPLQQYRHKKRINNQFLADFEALTNSAKSTTSRFEITWENRKPYLYDKTSNTGFDRHYVYHAGWAARVLNINRPDYHVDISSTLYFCSIVSAFIPIRFYDYRPAELVLEGLSSDHIDLTAIIWPDNSVKSLSCMHTVEHVGLGRYGDPIDYDGDLKAMNELSRVLAVDGDLLFVVPVGNVSQIIFNGHRIYTPELVISSFPNLDLVEFTLIPERDEDGGLVSNPPTELLARQEYACGCFWFKKKNK
jgi:hypothetical protein